MDGQHIVSDATPGIVVASIIADSIDGPVSLKEKKFGQNRVYMHGPFHMCLYTPTLLTS